MAIDSQLIDGLSHAALHTDNPFGLGPQLIIENFIGSHGVFKSVDFTVAATKIIAEPAPEGVIAVTDILVSAKKLNAKSVIVQFNDGTNVIKLMDFDNTNGIQQSIALSGLWAGWQDARLEAITDGTFNATIAAGYVKIKTGLPFSDWDALR